jgi:tetratricopeptide (TPR) repeat protein
MAHLDEDSGNLDRAAARFRDAALSFEMPTTPSVPEDGDSEISDRPRWAAIARLNLARVEARRGNAPTALSELETTLRASNTQELRDVHARALSYKAKVLGELGRDAESLETSRAAVRELQEVGLVRELLTTLLDFCHTAIFAGFPDNVLQAAGHAVTISTAMDDDPSLSRAHAYRAWAHLVREEKNDATREIAEAIRVGARGHISERARETIARIEADINDLPD